MKSVWARLLCLLALVSMASDGPRLSEDWLRAASPASNAETEPVPLKSTTEGAEEEALVRRPRVWRPVRAQTLVRLASPIPLRSTGDRSPPPRTDAPSPVCVRSIPLLC